MDYDSGKSTENDDLTSCHQNQSPSVMTVLHCFIPRQTY